MEGGLLWRREGSVTGPVSHQRSHSHSAHLPGQERLLCFYSPRIQTERETETQDKERTTASCSREGRAGKVRAVKVRDVESGAADAWYPEFRGLNKRASHLKRNENSKCGA